MQRSLITLSLRQQEPIKNREKTSLRLTWRLSASRKMLRSDNPKESARNSAASMRLRSTSLSTKSKVSSFPIVTITLSLGHTSKILELTSTIIELREVITVKRDVEAQLDRARDQISHLDSQKTQLIKEIETASDYIIEMEEKVYRANKTSLELLRQLKDAEVEIETLKNYIIELKQRIAVYIPVKDDPIDKRLAEFINNYPERQKLKIMFMRESEGVYQFGTKRVWVKVEKDKINLRVGGGFLSIDEFLD